LTRSSNLYWLYYYNWLCSSHLCTKHTRPFYFSILCYCRSMLLNTCWSKV